MSTINKSELANEIEEFIREHSVTVNKSQFEGCVVKTGLMMKAMGLLKKAQELLSQEDPNTSKPETSMSTPESVSNTTETKDCCDSGCFSTGDYVNYDYKNYIVAFTIRNQTSGTVCLIDSDMVLNRYLQGKESGTPNYIQVPCNDVYGGWLDYAIDNVNEKDIVSIIDRFKTEFEAGDQVAYMDMNAVIIFPNNQTTTMILLVDTLELKLVNNNELIKGWLVTKCNSNVDLNQMRELKNVVLQLMNTPDTARSVAKIAYDECQIAIHNAGIAAIHGNPLDPNIIKGTYAIYLRDLANSIVMYMDDGNASTVTINNKLYPNASTEGYYANDDSEECSTRGECCDNPGNMMKYVAENVR